MQPFGQQFALHRPQAQPRLGVEGHIQVDGRQLAREEGVVAAGFQLVAQAAAHLPQGPIDAVEVAVVVEQRNRGLGTDAPHAGDVVGAVAGEGLEVDHVLRRHPQLGDHSLAVDLGGAAGAGIGAAAHIENGDIALVIHQLEQIAVAGEDANAPAPLGRPLGQGAEHVVGLVAGSQAERQVEGVGQDRLQVGQIREEMLRGFLAVGLVVGVRHVAEGGLVGVEGHHHTGWGKAAAVVQQRPQEAIGHAGGDALLGAQPTIAALAERIEAAKGQGMAIDQQQQRFVRRHLPRSDAELHQFPR